MRNIKTKYVKTAMHNVAMRIRMDQVLHVSFIKEPSGGHFWLWVTPAGDHNDIQWQKKFYEGQVNTIDLPTNLINED